MNHEELNNASDLSNHPEATTGEPGNAAQTSPLAPPEIPTEDDLQRWTDLLWAVDDPEVQQRYAGKYVAVHQKQILAAGDELLAVYAEAEAKSGLPRRSIALVPVDDTASFFAGH